MFGMMNLLLSPVPGDVEPKSPIMKPPSEAYCAPGYWVACAARAKALGVSFKKLPLDHGQLREYAEAIGIQSVLGEADTYRFSRKNVGNNYSPLVILDSADDADRATQAINGCLRAIFADASLQEFVGDLCDLVGDLHDNVWSHGQSTGISAAQKWKKPNSKTPEFYIEFALADCGLGFLRELQRSGISQSIGISSHANAIDWCLERGNSSKKKKVDDWEQRLPWDTMGNPIGHDAKPIGKDNHHQGLGLYKLTSLVEKYGGELWLATGDAMLIIDSHGRRKYVDLPVSWDGVAIACRFCTESVRKRNGAVDETELDAILRELLS